MELPGQHLQLCLSPLSRISPATLKHTQQSLLWGLPGLSSLKADLKKPLSCEGQLLPRSSGPPGAGWAVASRAGSWCMGHFWASAASLPWLCREQRHFPPPTGLCENPISVLECLRISFLLEAVAALFKSNTTTRSGLKQKTRWWLANPENPPFHPRGLGGCFLCGWSFLKVHASPQKGDAEKVRAGEVLF